MKSKHASLYLIALATLILAGCTSMGSSDTKDMLSAAGFLMRTPETPKQKELYASAESYKVLQITANGKTLYAYKDEKNGTAYIGDETNYHQYQQLAMEHKIAQQQYQADIMQSQAAMGWYGAYSPYLRGPRVYGRVGRFR